MDIGQARLIGDYVLGPRIGSGSYAVVWRSKHRQSGMEVAVKEIDWKRLNPKVNENLVKEISILSTMNHPNVIRLFEYIETEERIYLVLEYCDGGDLAAYIQQHGKVSEAVARHFMRQLAAGLQVLEENHLIHRDLKPQNLLLSSHQTFPQLKIGDFGFARSLMPQGLADTVCGSPLYMAPEIMNNQKYDAKADLWSVGVILFQLVTGKPPFEGNSPFQLFHNISSSTELQFPQGALDELHPDCVDLCRSLLRQNPDERLTFNDFFNHKFLGEQRVMVDFQQSSLLPQMSMEIEPFDSPASDKRSQLISEHLRCSVSRSSKFTGSSIHDIDNIAVHGKDHASTSGTRSFHGSVKNLLCDRVRNSVDGSQCSSDTELMEDYVLVNPHVASMENFSFYLGTSLQHSSTTRACVCCTKQNDNDIAAAMVTKDLVNSSAYGAENTQASGSDPLAASQATRHPSSRLQLLCQYVWAIAELVQEKDTAGLFLESFSVQLVVLALWKKAIQICSSWLGSTGGRELPESSSALEFSPMQGCTDWGTDVVDKKDFTSPSSAYKWAEQGLIAAFDHAEKLSWPVQEIDAAAEMPDAMEMIFQKALHSGKSGAVDEYMENMDSATVSYSKAMLLFSFIVGEATCLPLNPPFSLTPATKKRIQGYVTNLRSHQSHFLALQRFPKNSA